MWRFPFWQMGVVASMAAAPVASEILRDEARRDRDRRDDARFGRHRHGDADLQLIKHFSLVENEASASNNPLPGAVNNGGGNHAAAADQRSDAVATGQFREGLTSAGKVEQVYLTGAYRDKYRYISSRVDRQLAASAAEGTPSRRKIRSAYPLVRI